MRREDWPNLAIFAAIARNRSFTRAGRELGVSASALSHAMKQFEAHLGVALLHRTTRSVAPTEAGARLLERLLPAMDEIQSAVTRLDEERDQPRGLLRVSSHRTAAEQVILPRLAGFARDYPEVTLELVIEDGLVDIVADGFDAGVRHAGVVDADMVAVQISPGHRVTVVAAPSYLAGRMLPQHPRELAAFRGLHYRYTSSRSVHSWQFERGGERLAITPPAAMISNDVRYLLDAALDGVGVGYVSEPQARPYIAEGRLVDMLADWCPSIPANYLYYPSRRGTSAALRALIKTLQSA